MPTRLPVVVLPVLLRLPPGVEGGRLGVGHRCVPHVVTESIDCLPSDGMKATILLSGGLGLQALAHGLHVLCDLEGVGVSRWLLQQKSGIDCLVVDPLLEVMHQSVAGVPVDHVLPCAHVQAPASGAPVQNGLPVLLLAPCKRLLGCLRVAGVDEPVFVQVAGFIEGLADESQVFHPPGGLAVHGVGQLFLGPLVVPLVDLLHSSDVAAKD